MGSTTEARIMQSISIFLLVAAFVQPVIAQVCPDLTYVQASCSQTEAACEKLLDKADDCFTKLDNIAKADETVCSVRNKTDALKVMSTDCEVHLDTSQVEQLAGNFTFDAETLLQASLEGIKIPTGVTLPAAPPAGWTVPAGYTLPSDIGFTMPPAANEAEDTANQVANDAENAANDALAAAGDLAAAGITP